MFEDRLLESGELIRVATGEPSRTRKIGNPELSIPIQRRDPKQFPEIAHVAEAYEKIRIYREWAFGRNTVLREPREPDMRSDRLEEDSSNLGLVIHAAK